jgi:hypothetical protein
MTSEALRDGSVGIGASAFSVAMHYLKPIGEIASSISAIIGCIVACIMLWRLIQAPYPYQFPPPAQPKHETKKDRTE